MMMKTIVVAGFLAAGLVGQASAGGQGKYYNDGHNAGYSLDGRTIVVSCYRGPWKEVIWDRPNAVFFDSLVAVGYSQPDAHAIAERICRDQDLVGNLQNMRAEVIRVIRAAPHYRK